MPLPKPKEDEVKDDFITRCMANEVMLSEYKDNKKRAAICNTQWENKGVNMNTLKLSKDDKDDIVKAVQKAFAKDDEDKHEFPVEIFSVGTWNGIKVTVDMLHDFAANFKQLKNVLRVPLKFGHNEKQSITDGQHALGWISEVWVNGNTLLGQVSEMPDIVFNAMQKKLYKTVSIEASFNVKYKDETFKNVLTGVALLGADLPAVNNLKDLTAYMSAKPDNLLLGDAKCFTYKDKEDNTMSEDLLKEQLKAEQDKFAASEKARLKAEGIAKDEKDKADKLLADSETAKFDTAKTSVLADLEGLVKENKLTPAKRDELVNSITDDITLAQVKFSADTLKDIKISAGVDDEEEGKAGKKGKTEATAEEVILAATNKFQAEGKDFKTAQELAFKANPKEAREYIDSNDEAA